MDRSLTNEEVDKIQEELRDEVVKQLQVELRWLWIFIEKQEIN